MKRIALMMALAGVSAISQVISGGGGGGGGATSASQLTDFKVVKTSGAVETINGSCSVGSPCNAQYGTAVYSFTAPGTVTISGTSNSGTVYYWLDSTGALNAGHNTTSTLTGSGVTVSTGITAFPPDTKPIAITTFTANVWDAVTGGMNIGSFFSVPGALTAGANTVLTKTGTNTTVAVPIARTLGATFGVKSGPVLTNTQVIYVPYLPFACTIARWTIAVDAGTATIDIWKNAGGTAVPTVANTITAAATPTIAANTIATSTTLTGWTTAVAVGDNLAFALTAVATATTATITLVCNQ